MSEIKLTKNSIENAILTDGKLVGGYVDNYGYISAKGNGAVAMGYAPSGGSMDASGNGAHAEGITTKALADGAHAEGQLTQAIGDNSHTEGLRSVAKGQNTHAEGYWTFAFGLSSHTEGQGEFGALDSVLTVSGNQFTLKNTTTTIDLQSYTLQVGDIVSDGSNFAKVTAIVNNEGDTKTITTDKEHGFEKESFIALIKGISYGENAHSEGYLTVASGLESHAEGYKTTASGTASHVEGSLTMASGNYSHAEGVKTQALAEGAHAEGRSAKAVGEYSHAEGDTTTASGTASHAEGFYVNAKGKYSHAEGNKTVALGDHSHVEGQGSTGAIGPVITINSSTQFVLNTISTTIDLLSFTLQVGDIINYKTDYAKVIAMVYNSNGNKTITTDKDFTTELQKKIKLVKGVSYETNSHSAGYLTTATGTASYAGGIGTIANQEAMTAIGKYNISGTTGDLFVVGSGESGQRRNAMRIQDVKEGLNSHSTYWYFNDDAYLKYDGPEKIVSLNHSNGHINILNDGYMEIGGTDSFITVLDSNDIDIIGIHSNNIRLEANVGTNTTVTVIGQVNATGGFYDDSDIRKKDVLSNISLEKTYKLLDKCQEIIYVLKDDPDKKELVGMIAQEVEEFFPEIVSTDNDGFKSLDYARLSVICLRIIKDIVELIKEIKNEIKNLKN